MKVKYIKNREIETPDVPFPVRNPREYLKIGKTYNVYGILFYNGELFYLIVGKYEKLDEYGTPPTWEPAELFEIVESNLPPEWYFKRSEELLSKEKLVDHFSACWGYMELACDPYHRDRLLAREEADIRIFLKRKHEIDEWESINNSKK